MPSLRTADDRFGTRLTVIEGGSGSFTGVVTEANQGTGSSQSYALPRRVLRVGIDMPVKAGMVVRDISATTFLVGLNGDSTNVFSSFILIPAQRAFAWQKRGMVRDIVTGLERDDSLVDQALIWGSYEPQQERFDRGLKMGIEAGKFVTNAPVQRDDVVDGKKVTRVDEALGLRMLTLG